MAYNKANIFLTKINNYFIKKKYKNFNKKFFKKKKK